MELTVIMGSDWLSVWAPRYHHFFYLSPGRYDSVSNTAASPVNNLEGTQEMLLERRKESKGTWGWKGVIQGRPAPFLYLRGWEINNNLPVEVVCAHRKQSDGFDIDKRLLICSS